MNVLGQENATFWGSFCYYILAQLLWLLHMLHILGQENATFWNDFCYYSLIQFQCYTRIIGPENAIF